MAYFDRKFATVKVDGEIDAVVARIHDYAEGEPFRAFMDSILEAVEETGCQKVLSDTTDMGPLEGDDQEWSVRDWSPRAEAAGVRHIAYVLPESVIANLSLDNLREMNDDDAIEREYFEDPEAAREWLREQGGAAAAGQRAAEGDDA